MSASDLEIMRPLYKWKSVRWQKCLTLYDLAYQATSAIVELGSYDGNGTIALALGAQAGNNAPVYGVDQYVRSTGIYHQEFYASDEGKLHRNASLCGVGIETIKADTRDAARWWDRGLISLVVWDLSLPDRMPDDFTAWMNLIEPGGLYVMKDNPKWDFSFNLARDVALEAGWSVDFIKLEACLWGLKKPL